MGMVQDDLNEGEWNLGSLYSLKVEESDLDYDVVGCLDHVVIPSGWLVSVRNEESGDWKDPEGRL